MNPQNHEKLKILVAPDKFKGSLTSEEAGTVIAEALKEVLPGAELLVQPMGDGGEGTAGILASSVSANLVGCPVHDPLFRRIIAHYWISPDGQTAYMEMAEASGLHLLSAAERQCMDSTSLGTGEMIRDATGKGVREIFLCLGGSATNDGGIGMATALGYKFKDCYGNIVRPIGRNLQVICRIDDSQVMPLLHKVKFRVISDVSSPLTGNAGAARTFALQKGAREEDIPQLDEGLKNLAGLVRDKYNIEIDRLPGAGAAGGLGGGAMAFLHAKPESGIEVVIRMTGLDEKIRSCDLVITGEGQLDQQTLRGKTIYGIGRLASQYHKPVVAVCGISALSASEMQTCGLIHVEEISKNEIDAGTAVNHTKDNLRSAIIRMGNKLVQIMNKQR